MSEIKSAISVILTVETVILTGVILTAIRNGTPKQRSKQRALDGISNHPLLPNMDDCTVLQYIRHTQYLPTISFIPVCLLGVKQTITSSVVPHYGQCDIGINLINDKFVVIVSSQAEVMRNERDGV